MIYYLVTEKHSRPVTGWLRHFSSLWAFRFTLLPYERISGWVPPGAFIFTDYERLTPSLRRKALLIHKNALKAGCVVLNHPRRSLRRYDLQKTLNNAFRVFRPGEIPDDLRFPVFLREENEHRGTLTPLLETWDELESGLGKYPDCLTVEYIDTSDRNGIFRKYATLRIGSRMVPRHIWFSRRWMQKTHDLSTKGFLDEEMDFLHSTDHEEQLSKIFDLARCDYGRIDYSFLDGEIQTWEINSNPMLLPIPELMDSRRAPSFQLSGQSINKALARLDMGNQGSQSKVWCG